MDLMEKAELVKGVITGDTDASDIVDSFVDDAKGAYETVSNLTGGAIDAAQDFIEDPAGVAGEVVGNVLNLAADVVGSTPAGKLVNGLLGALGKDNNRPTATTTTASYYIPSLGAELDGSSDGLFQSSPLLNTYSPRLFGSPHQLTHLCDMRLMSSDGESPGPVGDFYLEKILENGQVANFVIGRAVFTGGMNGILAGIRNMIQYASAMKNYGEYINATNAAGKNSRYIVSDKADLSEANFDHYKKLMEDSNSAVNSKDFQMQQDENGLWVDSNVEDEGIGGMLDSLSGVLSSIGADMGAIRTALKTSYAIQQPFYAFDSDWYSYIQRVKMMINSFIIMLGLSEASVRIGDDMFSIAMNKYDSEKDVWANYRFITPNKDLGVVTAIDTQNGDTSQYVSFMIDLSKKTMKIIKQNLFWALFYNAIFIPVAAGVFYKSLNLSLNPMIGAITMSISSIFVLTNALRINSIKKEEVKTMNKTVSIEGMMCEHCVSHVKKALEELGAIAEVSLEENKAYLKDTSLSDDQIKKAIEDAGYEVTSINHE